MLEFKNGQYLIDGEARLIMAGEIHYFRLAPRDWQNRIDQLKSCGLNTVSTYVPWFCHQFDEDELDLDGSTNPRLNLKAFIELCRQNQVYLFLRPGPFIMAEIINEGIPEWVYTKHPHLIPTTFDRINVKSRTLDYTHPDFIDEVKRWFQNLAPIIRPQLFSQGGPILALQLDNEIGMLSWVNNQPDLTAHVLEDFKTWLQRNYSNEDLTQRYPFSLETSASALSIFASPASPYDVFFHLDYAKYSRHRFADYVHILHNLWLDLGIEDVYFFVNIHGTSDGRGFTYPIGVSQLMETYAKDDCIMCGSDVYFGNMTMQNIQDIYLCNAITNATISHGKPLACTEFNCGDSNFADDFNTRDSSSSNDFKTRLFIAQGNRLLNYYLFCGGENYRVKKSLGNGHDRIAFTGQNHGFAAPIAPDGEENYTFPRMSRVTKQMMAMENLYATSAIEYDSVGYAFIPEYYATEYCYEHALLTKDIYHNIIMHRNGNSWESIVRAILLSAIKLEAVNLETSQAESLPKALIVSTASFLSAHLQTVLVDYLKLGGRLLLHGRIPLFDEEGIACTILSDYLGASDIQEYEYGGSRLVALTSCAQLSFQKEYFVSTYATAEIFGAQTLIKSYDSGKSCGFFKQLDVGKAIILTCPQKCNLGVMNAFLQMLDIHPSITHDIDTPGCGVVITNTVNNLDERIFHIINLDDVEKGFTLTFNGQSILPNRRINLPANDALALPLNVKLPFGKILYASVEILSVSEKSVAFRITEKYSVIAIESEFQLICNNATVERKDQIYLFNTDNRLLDEEILISVI